MGGDKATLEDRLTRLAASGVADADGRALRAARPDALLARLLTEVELTVMPRRLILNGASGEQIVLGAGNGRITRIESTSVGGFEDLTGRAFEAADMTMSDRLKDLFKALIKGTDTVFVQYEHVSETLDPERTGLPAAGLAEAWGTPLHPGRPDAGAAIDSFLGATQGLLTAWVLTGTDLSDHEGAGDPDTVEELTAFAEARREAGETDRLKSSTGDEPWTALALHRAPEAADVTVVISIEDVLLYVVVPRVREGEAMDAWRAAIGAA